MVEFVHLKIHPFPEYFPFYILSIISIILTVPTASSFSDNFNDQDISDWTLVGGSFSFQTAPPVVDGSYYLRGNDGGNGRMWHTDLNATRYWEITLYGQGNINGANFAFQSNASSILSNWQCSGGVNALEICRAEGYVYGRGFTYSTFTVPNALSTWTKAEITDLGSTIRVKLYNVTSGNNTLLNSQVGAKSINMTNLADRVYIDVAAGASYGAGLRFEDLYTSTTIPSQHEGAYNITTDKSLYGKGENINVTYNAPSDSIIYIVKNDTEVIDYSYDVSGSGYQVFPYHVENWNYYNGSFSAQLYSSSLVLLDSDNFTISGSGNLTAPSPSPAPTPAPTWPDVGYTSTPIPGPVFNNYSNESVRNTSINNTGLQGYYDYVNGTFSGVNSTLTQFRTFIMVPVDYLSNATLYASSSLRSVNSAPYFSFLVYFIPPFMTSLPSELKLLIGMQLTLILIFVILKKGGN